MGRLTLLDLKSLLYFKKSVRLVVSTLTDGPFVFENYDISKTEFDSGEVYDIDASPEGYLIITLLVEEQK